jgi:hypothetical protein
MVVTWLPSIDIDDAPSSRRKVGFPLIDPVAPTSLAAVMVAIWPRYLSPEIDALQDVDSAKDACRLPLSASYPSLSEIRGGLAELILQ